MRKEELRKLRTLNATKEMMEKANNNTIEVEEKSWSGRKVKKKIYGVFLRCQNLGPYLKVAIFLPGNMEKGITSPRYEIFINQEGKEWITRELDDNGVEKKWLTAMIENLPELSWWNYGTYKESSKGEYLNQDALKSINRLTFEKKLKNERGIRRIFRWQQYIREERIEEKEKREQAPWDADMELMPETPKSFIRWMEKEVPEQNYIFYEYERGGAKTGYCRHCECDVPLIRPPKHRAEMKCPKCKRKSILISTGKIRSVNGGESYGQIIQGIIGGFVVRTFRVGYRIYTENYKKPEYFVSEYARTLFRGTDIDAYDYTMYKNKYTRWCKVSRVYFYYENEDKTKLFKGNIGRIRPLIEKQSALPLLIKEGKSIRIERYLCEEKKHPVIEMLAKAGMVDMAAEYANLRRGMSELDESQTELVKILKIDNARMKRLKKMGAGSDVLHWLQQERKKNTIWENEMIQYFAKAGLDIREFNFASKMMSLKKIYNYLRKQEQLTGEEPKQLLKTWKDYLNMAFKLKMNMDLEMIYKPKNLLDAHAEAIEMIERGGMEKIAKQTAKRFPKVDEVCKTLKKYEYADGKYCIIAPDGIVDIVREGTILRHCIHTCDYYFDRISRKESYLLFLRAAGRENIPWYTLEVEPGGNIRQKRTTGDVQKKDLDKAIPFLKKWQKEIKKRMGGEEEELAKIADQKRKENYESLKRNGNRIWHGRLQGQLLAEVLEQDFMEAI